MRQARLFPVVLAALLAACGKSEPEARPSVILISIDTLRADHMGLYGYERDTSPFLDRLGARSVVFEHVFTSAAWTLIAHMTMLTGLYPEQHGVIEGDEALSEDAPLLAERLRAQGYQTLALFRPGWIHERHGFGRGFDVFRPHHAAEEAEQHLTEELARLSPERPTFLFLHLFDVHNDPSTKVPPTVFSAPAPFEDLFLPGSEKHLAGQTYLSMKQRPLGPGEREALVALYDDGIRHVDSVLERIFANLESRGLLQKSLVIVTADHGESLAQRGRMTGHGGPWQEGLHVPLILHLPDDARAGKRVSEIAHLVDIVPTVLDWVHLPHDALLPGRSLLQPLPKERVITGGNDPVEFTVQWPEKLMRFGKTVGKVDLDQDPAELDVQPTSAEELARLRAELGLAPGSFHAPLQVGTMSEEDRRELEALGYGGQGEDK